MVRAITTLDGLISGLREHHERLLSLGPDHDPTGSLDLRRCDFAGVHFQEVKMIGADLSMSSIKNSDLYGVYATSVRWVSGVAIGSSFAKANFSYSSYEDVDFEGCNLLRTDLSHSTFNRVTFVGCDLTKTRFSGSAFENTTFVDCKFEKTLFSDVRFRRSSVISPTKLEGVHFPGAVTDVSRNSNDPLTVLSEAAQFTDESSADESST